MARAMRMRRTLTIVGVALPLIVFVIGTSLAAAHGGPALTPATVDAVLFPGASTDIAKTVHTPAIPPKPDICFLADTTGSMGTALANVKANATSIMNTVLASSPDAQFCAAQYRDVGDTPVFRVDKTVTGVVADVQTAINAWAAGGGGDTPEAQLNALTEMAGATPGWRAAPATHVIVWFGDNPGHDPSLGATLASTITALTTGGAGAPVLVIAVPVNTGGLGLDSTGQATAIATATGGSVQPANPDTVAAAILAGLSALPVTVAMESTCVPPISTSFTPASQVVTSGTDAVFTETISVAGNAPGGTYTCRDVARLNGEIMRDANGQVIYELKTIRVPEGFLTGGGFIDNGKKDAARISWGGNVGFLADSSLVGEWNTIFHNVAGTALDGAHFHAHDFSSLQFLNDGGAGPNPPPANANIAAFIAVGELNGVPGYRLSVCVADRGEPGKGNDTMRMELFAPSATKVYDSLTDFIDQAPTAACDGHKFDGGNAQIHSGLKT